MRPFRRLLLLILLLLLLLLLLFWLHARCRVKLNVFFLTFHLLFNLFDNSAPTNARSSVWLVPCFWSLREAAPCCKWLCNRLAAASDSCCSLYYYYYAYAYYITRILLQYLCVMCSRSRFPFSYLPQRAFSLVRPTSLFLQHKFQPLAVVIRV